MARSTRCRWYQRVRLAACRQQWPPARCAWMMCAHHGSLLRLRCLSASRNPLALHHHQCQHPHRRLRRRSHRRFHLHHLRPPRHQARHLHRCQQQHLNQWRTNRLCLRRSRARYSTVLKRRRWNRRLYLMQRRPLSQMRRLQQYPMWRRPQCRLQLHRMCQLQRLRPCQPRNRLLCRTTRHRWLLIHQWLRPSHRI